MLLQETKIKLSKAVLLKDAFTGEVVKSGIQVSCLSSGKVEQKSGGYLLFLDVMDTEFEVMLDSPVYQRRNVLLKADRGEEVEEICLYPSPSYPMQAGCTAVRGKAEPGSLLRFHIEDAGKNCRLIKDYKKGEAQVSFYWKRGVFPPLWHIEGKQQGKGEYFLVKGVRDGQEPYRLDGPLRSSYPKKDTVVCPAMETVADDKGEFYLLIRDLPQEKCSLHYAYGKAHGVAEIFRAKENVLLWEV